MLVICLGAGAIIMLRRGDRLYICFWRISGVGWTVRNSITISCALSIAYIVQPEKHFENESLNEVFPEVF